jgi:hypothetical protein
LKQRGLRHQRTKTGYVIKQVGPWSNSIPADARRLMHSLCTEFRTERSVDAIAVVLEDERARRASDLI